MTVVWLGDGILGLSNRKMDGFLSFSSLSRFTAALVSGSPILERRGCTFSILPANLWFEALLFIPEKQFLGQWFGRHSSCSGKPGMSRIRVYQGIYNIAECDIAKGIRPIRYTGTDAGAGWAAVLIQETVFLWGFFQKGLVNRQDTCYNTYL